MVMNMRKAFADTFKLAKSRGMDDARIADYSLSYEHLVDMQKRVCSGQNFSEAKLGRWLGWAQAAVVASGVATFADMKTINKENANG